MPVYAREGRDNNFHVIRHLAAMAVVLTHSFSIPTGLYASEPLVALTGTSIGHYAVDVFFLLSGFLVTQSIARNKDLVRFTLARLLRIFPALLVSVLLTALVLGPAVSSIPASSYFADPLTWKYIAGAGSTLFDDGTLPGVFAAQPEAGKINIPLWTLKYELAAYALLGVMVALSLLRARWVIALFLATLALAYVAGRSVYAWPASEGMVSNLLHLLPAFFIGSAAYLLRDRIPYGLPLAALLALSAFLLRDTPAYEIAEKLLFASVVLWIAFLPSRAGQAFARTGDYSYGIYIFHFPILQTIHMSFPGIGPAALFVVGMAATLPMAALSWHWIEKPGMRLRGRFEDAVRSTPLAQSLAGKLPGTGAVRS